jgi:hypothetical protein
MRLGGDIRLLCAIVAVSAAVLAQSAIASAAKRLPCPRKQAEVIASDKLVRVYVYPPTKERYPRPRRTEACLVGGGARMTLLNPEGERGFRAPTFDVVALSGTAVAYSIGRHGVDSGASEVVVADIATRRIVQELPGESFADAGFLGRTTRTDFVLDHSGSAAWIDEVVGPISKRTRSFAVHRAPVGEEEVVLDESADIAPHSLELRAGTLRWQDVGMQRAARLNP